ncbi:MAG: hypothetical protein GYA14_15060, partial [Ignavibacteria bacterium]|nr:hypothetical protein [Ignavibacteria bacterium]
MRSLFYSLFIIINISILAQEADITPALRQIDSGDITSANNFLRELKSKKTNDPSTIF